MQEDSPRQKHCSEPLCRWGLPSYRAKHLSVSVVVLGMLMPHCGTGGSSTRAEFRRATVLRPSPEPGRDFEGVEEAAEIVRSLPSCIETIRSWRRWNFHEFQIISWNRYQRAFLYAQAWRLWFDWTSPATTRSSSRSSIAYFQRSLSLSEAARESAPYETASLLARSAQLAGIALHFHAATIAERNAACRSRFESARDNYLQESTNHLELVVRYLGGVQNSNPTQRRPLSWERHALDYANTLLWTSDRPRIEESNHHCDALILRCIAARASSPRDSHRETCLPGIECSSGGHRYLLRHIHTFDQPRPGTIVAHLLQQVHASNEAQP